MFFVSNICIYCFSFDETYFCVCCGCYQCPSHPCGKQLTSLDSLIVDSWLRCLCFADYFDEDAEEGTEKDCENEDAENKEEVSNLVS